MKRTLSALLVVILLISLLTACGTKDDPMHTLYFKDSNKSQKVTATFFNSVTKDSVEIEMKKIGEDNDSYTFSCEGDTSLYNMVNLTYDGEKTTDFAFNKCVSGWYKTEDNLLPYAEGEEISYVHAFETFTLDGYDSKKIIHIWKPDDYDAQSSEKYAVVYVLDGQIMLYQENGDHPEIKGCPVANEHIKAMTAATGYKAIMVAIESGITRDYELVPEIGESADEKMFKERSGKTEMDEFDGMNGTQYADFLANTLVPYIQEHYNVYTDALHTSIAGVSLSGMEAFYTAMEFPEVFGTAGAISPSFWEYDAATWEAYLIDKTFDDHSPFLYFYTGPEKLDTDPDVTQMYERLKGMGYPEDKLALHFNEEGRHDSIIWRNVFSEFLTGMVYRHIEPLQQSMKSTD